MDETKTVETQERAGGRPAETTASAVERPVGAPPLAVSPESDPDISRIRALGAAALTSAAAGAMAGGVFGATSARVLAAGAAVFGVGWAWLTLISKRTVIFQALILPVSVLIGTLLLIPGASDPSQLPTLVQEAVTAGRLLRPPAPFDPGWRPILFVLFAMLGFASGWVGTGLARPKLALALPLPLLALTAISQPAEADLAAGLLGFVPLLGALALLFGGGSGGKIDLSSQFEVKRAIRGVGVTVLCLGLLVGLNTTDLLFPKPRYNPAEQPQKPRPIPLGEVRDRVLFEVEAGDTGITGPWRTGVLDVYDGTAWRLPPFNEDRFEALGRQDAIDETRSDELSVRFTVRDLGDTPTLPGLAGPTRFNVVELPEDIDFVLDPRVDVVRVSVGRVPDGMVYELHMPPYPTGQELQDALPPEGIDEDLLWAPRPPPSVQQLIDQAPLNLWDRLDFLRNELEEVAIAVGAGMPVDVPPEKVHDLLFGSHEGSPFEIVAAEVLLARWAGIPARIGYGFDGFNEEDGAFTVRPKNASNWLEVYFEGYGFVPIIGAPRQAKASLDTDPDARFDPTIEPSDDIAVEIFIPIELESLRLLYERIRWYLLQALPWILLVVATYLSMPALRRALRRRRRRQWAEPLGPRAQIAVEYAEFRDLASDLNLGDPYDTPIEYLDKVVEDDEHQEFAWLVSRVMYGDLSESASEEDVAAAREMSTSLRRRMFRAQPFQTRMLGLLSRASLRDPYTLEVPSVRMLRGRRGSSTGDGKSRNRLRRLAGVGGRRS